VHGNNVRDAQFAGDRRSIHSHHEFVTVNHIHPQALQHSCHTTKKTEIDAAVSLIRVPREAAAPKGIYEPPVAVPGDDRMNAVAAGSQLFRQLQHDHLSSAQRDGLYHDRDREPPRRGRRSIGNGLA
jgi:hypothetical protein